ncbi:ABC transporter permease [Paenibacillus ginsengarvi]|uniref:ABC transporter permease n=1 Tax=Paenibacillus ginsengarvi TaxID=400777 RepID=A0A3B0CRS3_9BACL|nr:ABC transporter permease [Paenibacillus ginsengarvi]RKN86598.1 ABC transporter permease [Paenibacillus ginsengarvi]
MIRNAGAGSGDARPADLPSHVLAAHRKLLRRRAVAVLTTQIAILLVFLAVWEVAGRRQWIDVLLFSYPSKIARLLAGKLADGSLMPHVWTTVLETGAGFLLGTLLGTALATLIWWSPFLSRVLDPYLVVANSMPKVALGPLFIVGLGPNMGAIIATTLAVTVIITTLVVYASFKEVDDNYVKVVRMFGGTKSQSFRKAILPASIPAIVSTLKVNVGLAWVGVIVGEFLVSKQGLGYLIIYGFQVFNFTLVLGSLVIIAIVATVMYRVVASIEARLNRKP